MIHTKMISDISAKILLTEIELMYVHAQRNWSKDLPLDIMHASHLREKDCRTIAKSSGISRI